MSNGELSKSSSGTKVDPRALKLRRRLGSVPEIVQKYGLPKEDDAPVTVGRGRSLSNLPPHLEDGPEATERQKKRETLKTTLRSYEKMIPVYERTLGDGADASYRNQLPDYKKRAIAVDVIRSHQEACQVMDQLLDDLSAGSREMNDAVALERKKTGLLDALDEAAKINVAPEYEGKAIFKSTGKKEFEQSVVRPVGDFLRKIDATVRAGQPLNEAEQGELAQLCTMLQRKSSDYDDKADTVDEKKNKHTHKLYRDYEKKCDKLREHLLNIQEQSVPKVLSDYREKKRAAATLLDRLDKRVELWQKIDPEALESYRNLAALKRNEFQEIVNAFDGDQNAGVARDALVKLIPDLQRTIDGLFGSAESNKALNEQVKKLGPKPTSKKDIEFLKEALMARFNMSTVSGDLTGTSLVAFYNTMSLVPDSHTKLNKWLTDLERHMSLEDVSSYYSAKEKNVAPEPKGLVAIKAMRSSGPLAMAQNGLMGPLLLKNVEGNKKVDQFTWVTLHEIGHAVDHSDSFMKNNNADYGDWKKHSVQDVQKMMTDDLAGEFKTYPKTFIAKYVGFVMAGKKPQDQEELMKEWNASIGVVKAMGADEEKRKTALLNSAPVRMAEQARLGYEANGWPDKGTVDGAMLNCINAQPAVPDEYSSKVDALVNSILGLKKTAAVAVDEMLEELGSVTSSKPDWDALKKSDAMVWYKAAVLVEPAGVLEGIKQMTGAANWVRAGELPRKDGRIWQEAYKGQWLSYDAAIRTDRVTDYQMRADGEYFAEAYAAYFMGKLPATARLHDALVELEKKTALAN
ncbi:MAG: hypothetical protein U1A77_12105 [Pirellulales bacterium]